ncbi:Inner membrane protein YhaI [Roseivivax jejudonensis]|uniref:Inner membrane protein YhaI n=2 Tax=Roseivivax jejudonensis TaxID=1529041 RepID=A0A1X7A824_9RHOB|nr:Inner membrane protein YhaI [Roseivivax jejudonensis]
MEWYYANGDERDGPVPEHALDELAAEGTIRADTLVWRSGMKEWEPAWKHVPRLAPEGSETGTGVPASGQRRAGGPQRDYHRKSDPVDAAREFFRRYLDFQGRSNRGEFWYWILDNLVLSIIAYAIGGDTLQSLWGLATLIPGIALAVRRLHDIGKSGWWVLLWLIPVIGWIILIYWYAQRPEAGPNAYG